MTINSAWNIAHFRKPVLQALIEDGHELVAAAPYDEAADRLRDLGCRFIDLRMDPKSISLFSESALLARIVRLLRDERPDAVLSWTIKNNIYFGLAGRLSSVPVLPNVSGLGTAFLSGKSVAAFTTNLYRIGFTAAPTVFFQNYEDRDLFVNQRMVRAEQSRVLPGSGIDLEYFNATKGEYRPKGKARFLMIARLLRDKGVVEYVEAAREIGRTHPDVRFALIGPLGAANRTAISKSMLDEWIREGVVEYLGVTDDVRSHIASSDCVVLPSYREGAPRTLLEAQAMARPVIATDVPGCRHVVDPGRSAFLCQARSAESLALALRQFLDVDEIGREQMGLVGRAKMEREYDEAIVIKAYRDAIAAL